MIVLIRVAAGGLLPGQRTSEDPLHSADYA